MLALAACATEAATPYAGVGYSGPAYADADECYYPGYVGVCNPYVYGPDVFGSYWDGYRWRNGWHRSPGDVGWHGERGGFHGGFGVAHGGFGIAHGGFGGGHGRG
jgi:hypothetical protein